MTLEQGEAVVEEDSSSVDDCGVELQGTAGGGGEVEDGGGVGGEGGCA